MKEFKINGLLKREKRNGIIPTLKPATINAETKADAIAMFEKDNPEYNATAIDEIKPAKKEDAREEREDDFGPDGEIKPKKEKKSK